MTSRQRTNAVLRRPSPRADRGRTGSPLGSVPQLGHGQRRHLHLARQVTDSRLGKTGQLTKTIVYHSYRVTSLAELDEVFGQ
jgi:hypothetical protein